MSTEIAIGDGLEIGVGVLLKVARFGAGVRSLERLHSIRCYD